MLDRFVPPEDQLEPGERRRPDLLWALVAAASFVSPLLIVIGRRFLFTDDPATSQQGHEAVAEHGGCAESARSSVSRRESTAPLVPVSKMLPRVSSRNKVGCYTAVGGLELAEDDAGAAADEVGTPSSPVTREPPGPDTPGMP